MTRDRGVNQQIGEREIPTPVNYASQEILTPTTLPNSSSLDALLLSGVLEPGKMEVRNPAIAMALRRIDMCEQAGTGLRMMRREWQALGHAAPVYANDRSRKAFELLLSDKVSRVGFATEIAAEEATDPVTDPVHSLLHLLAKGALPPSAIQKALGLKHRPTFRTNYLYKALADNLIEMTLPETPNSRLQRYRLTEAGQRLQAVLKQHKQEADHD